MPRQLPWLTDSKRPSKISVPSPRPRPRSPLSPDRRSNHVRTKHERFDSRPDRANSSSPVSPQSPIREEFMYDGLNGDDIWIMVEDEFLDTAKMFTRHLHRAEYQRLKSLANAENSDRTDLILRPVVNKGKISKEQAHKTKAHKAQDAQEAALSKLAGLNRGKDNDAVSSDDEDTPWMREPHLGKLMRRPPSTSKNLASAAGIKSHTRAAAGFTKPRLPSPSRRPLQQNTASTSKNYSAMAGLAKELGMASASDEGEDEVEDDLDTPIPSSLTSKAARSYTPRETPAPSKPQPKRPIERSFTHEPPRPRLTFTTKSPSISGRSHTISETQSSLARTQPITSLSSFATQDTRSTQSTDTSSARDAMIRRKAAKAKKEKEQQKKSYSLDEIPTFLV